jgi:hypothetical protein
MKWPWVSRERFEAADRERLQLLDMLLNGEPVQQEERLATRRVVPVLEKDPLDAVAEAVGAVREREADQVQAYTTPFDSKEAAFTKRYRAGSIPAKFRARSN